MKVFVLDPETWLRGEQNSALLRASDGKMCCQGQRCVMLGLSYAEIRDKGEVVELLDGPPERLWEYPHPELSSDVDKAAYAPNDNVEDNYGDGERVQRINAALKENGAKYRFALPTVEHPAMTVYEE